LTKYLKNSKNKKYKSITINFNRERIIMNINEIYSLIERSNSFICIVDDCFDGELNYNNKNSRWVCSKCGEEFTDDDIAEHIEDKENEMAF
jgi:transcription initiation factor IIE alpha subunit